MTFLRGIIARQFARPSGIAGLLMRGTLNKVNARVNRAALDLLNPGPADRLLDIGFGGGLMLRQALERLPEGSAAGLEISLPMLKMARRSFRREIAAGRLEVVEGSVSAIPYPDNTFDIASAVNTLHFWPDPAGGLADVLRVLQPAGRLVIVLRPREYLDRIQFTELGFTAYGDAELQALLEAAGFTDVAVEQRADREMGMQLAIARKP